MSCRLTKFQPSFLRMLKLVLYQAHKSCFHLHVTLFCFFPEITCLATKQPNVTPLRAFTGIKKIAGCRKLAITIFVTLTQHPKDNQVKKIVLE